MATLNLGQSSGMMIRTTPPENINLIWYDSTPNQMCHKVYDVNLNQWVVLDKNVISNITYEELTTLASNPGLSIGAWFKISNKGNVLAIAISSTKVQYTDVIGNIVIDDLGTNIQYHVTSSNLLIDDVAGVFDVVHKKLVFQFSEVVPDFTADDFVLGKIKRNDIWSLARYKLSSFLSEVNGNSISWNGGFFFNFNSAINAILDRQNGVVSKTTYDLDIATINQAITNVGKENQTIIQNANQAITNVTSSDAIYNKALPSDLVTTGVPTDIAKGDSLLAIVTKVQKWITKFKTAIGINIAQDFKNITTLQYINNTDTVQSSFEKIQAWLNFLNNYQSFYKVIFQSDLHVINNRYLEYGLSVGQKLEILNLNPNYSSWNTTGDVMSIWNTKADFDANNKPIIQILFKDTNYPKFIEINKFEGYWTVKFLDKINALRYLTTSYSAGEILKIDLTNLSVSSNDVISIPGSTKIQNTITLNLSIKSAASEPVSERDQLKAQITSTNPVTSIVACNIFGVYPTTQENTNVDVIIAIPSMGSSNTYYFDDLNDQYLEEIDLKIKSLTPTTDNSSDYIINPIVNKEL